VVEAVDAFAELLADFIERGSIAMPKRQDAMRAAEDVDLVDIARRVGDPGDDAQLFAPDRESPGLAEAQCPGDVSAFQPQFAEKLGAG